MLLSACLQAGPPGPQATMFSVVEGGEWHSRALDATGTAWAWGHSGVGQVGNGTSQVHRLVPVPVQMP